MERKDSNITFKLNSAPEEDYVDNEEDLTWNKKKRNVISRWFKMPDEIPYLWFAIGFLILVILLILFFPKSRSEIDEKQFVGLEARLKKLEDKVAKLEVVDEKVTQIWEQAKDFEQFKKRFDRSEKSLLLRMDHIVSSMDRMQKKIVDSKFQRTDSSRTKKATKGARKKQYHTVISGETLFSISRQYGITVDKIRSLNKLGDNAAIQPGQKLLVRP